MFDVPIDAWYIWIGASIVSIAVFSLAVAFPTSAAPDAAAVADTVDTVAADTHASTAEHPLSVDAVRLGPHRVALRDGGVTAHATFAYGPVTPVPDATLLWEVVQGAPPDHVFDSPAAFRRAAADARNRTHEWRSAENKLVVRSVSWEGVDVTLVDG